MPKFLSLVLSIIFTAITWGDEFTIDWVTDIQSVAKGGIDRGTELPSLLTLSVDSGENEAAGQWYISAIATFGGDPSEHIGDLQVTSNVEAHNTARIYELWYARSFGANHLLFGLHDLNSEFQVLDAAGLFLNSSFGVTPELSQTGPSIYPELALGVRWKREIDAHHHILTAVYDGVVGQPGHPNGNHIHLGGKDGLLAISEWQYHPQGDVDESTGKIALGLWRRTTNWEDIQGRTQTSASGLYALAEGRFVVPGTGRPMDAFIQIGRRFEHSDMLEGYFGAGLNLHNPFNLSQANILGVAIAHARTSRAYRESNTDLASGETTLELTWVFEVTDWLQLQPDIQWIRYPSANRAIDNALAVGLRIALSY
ncbi:MAG: hypothetical protein D6694_02245 [Gammaproteobacteria bacterium]|nr:MAG: hypothetical protein D6694_02245 [Gammaproteobacteria bacterium]